ncbi:hypothetical protein ACIBK8_35330 [Streptomyces sp. NPDC050161]|uniref:hypothetical protein n=1 Tax=Streptomyces sp. NPDC050161 TaxID=3365604 RepID=UPI0037905291
MATPFTSQKTETALRHIIQSTYPCFRKGGYNGNYGTQQTAVTFGPGHPVHFDIQVPAGTLIGPVQRGA